MSLQPPPKVQKLQAALHAKAKGSPTYRFDAISHEWMMKFLEHRIADRRILRLIRKWLRAGVSEDGSWSKTEMGTPQGAVISPLLASVMAFRTQAIRHWLFALRRRREDAAHG